MISPHAPLPPPPQTTHPTTDHNTTSHTIITNANQNNFSFISYPQNTQTWKTTTQTSKTKPTIHLQQTHPPPHHPTRHQTNILQRNPPKNTNSVLRQTAQSDAHLRQTTAYKSAPNKTEQINAYISNTELNCARLAKSRAVSGAGSELRQLQLRQTASSTANHKLATSWAIGGNTINSQANSGVQFRRQN